MCTSSANGAGAGQRPSINKSTRVLQMHVKFHPIQMFIWSLYHPLVVPGQLPIIYKLPKHAQIHKQDIASTFTLDKQLERICDPWGGPGNVTTLLCIDQLQGAQRKGLEMEMWLGGGDKQIHRGQQVVCRETGTREQQLHYLHQLLTCCLWSLASSICMILSGQRQSQTAPHLYAVPEPGLIDPAAADLYILVNMFNWVQ